jgi:uncharacterized tellurite resistance protein B-like protein
MHVLKELREFFAADGRDATPGPDLRLAMAVLLVEVARADQTIAAGERAFAARVLEHFLELRGPPAEALLTREETARHANDFFAFTTVINERLARPQRIALVEQMWQLALGDGDACPEEMQTISRLAGLLTLTHGEYIAAKLRAREATGVR